MLVGFETVCRVKDYNKALGSARLRCYDLINYFRGDDEIDAELYNPTNKNYDIVVFQKMFDRTATDRVKILKGQGVKTVLDVGTNYLDLDTKCVSQVQKDLCLNMLKVVDYVSVSSRYLMERYSRIHDKVYFINDAVEDNFFAVLNKRHSEQSVTNLIYCGYHNKAKELSSIKHILLDIQESFRIKLTYITDKDPGNFMGIPYEFVRFNYAELPKQLVGGDIKLSPRNLDRIYNRGHSVIKVAYPMSLGLPVVASPIPSYLPYLQDEYICHTDDEWYNSLFKLIGSSEVRNSIGQENRAIVCNELCLSKVAPRWKSFFKEVAK